MAASNKTTQTRRKPRSRGTVKQVEVALFAVLRELESRVVSDLPVDELCRLSHALATVAGTWSRLHEQFDVEARLDEIEQSLNG